MLTVDVYVTDKKDENLKKGRLLVVAFLTKLPLTTHDPNAFILDVVHVSAASLIFTVYGVFKESESLI
jgi:nuclear RNA export factor